MIVVLLGCGAEQEVESDPTRVVVTVRAERDTAVDRLVLLGDVHGRVEQPVVAELPEHIREVHVEEGDFVHAGDVLVTLDPSMLGADVAQASAAVRAAEAQRDQLRADIARVEPLVSANAVPRSQLDALRASLRGAEAQISQLSSGRRAASLRRAQTQIHAPVDGTVARLSAEAGALTAPGQPLCWIVDARTLDIEVPVVEQDFVRLRRGMSATVAPPSLPDVQRPGEVVALSPVLDPISRTGEVTVRVDNEDGRIRPGMVAEIDIELERRANVLLVPSRAVIMTTRTDQDRSAAMYVVRDGQARRIDVQLGRRYAVEAGESLLEVIDGLEEGEAIVVQGQHLLRDGAPVRESENEASS